MFPSLLPLLFPHRCLVCKAALDSSLALCSLCGLSWSINVKMRKMDGTLFRYSCTYNPVSSQIILKAKEENNARARNTLAQSIARAIEDSSSFLIPIPSRPSANRMRGYRHATLLAREAISLAGGNRNQVIDCLRVTGSTVDQAGLNSNERQENLNQKFSVNSRLITRLDSGSIFIIDDLVTSGASAREAIRALLAVNVRVAGVISACAVLPH